ncbi:hypothetical protein [Aliikangiella sp. IMCC44359]|uniref:hypothetical protein n=1 Tax=Aliikangiella sp. IMCC44359 TaxID=3459125 RepID=UPI00403A8855
MSIIKCPSCKERISDKAKICSHCQFSLVKGTGADGATQEQIASKAKLARMKKRYSLQMQAMSGLILFLAGIVIWYFVGEKGLTKTSHFMQLGAAALGAIWYLITRFRLLLFKKS